MATKPSLSEYIGVRPKTGFDLARLVERGLPTRSVARLRENGLTYSEVSDIVISPRTLKHRNARREPLSHEETDRVVRVARIAVQAEEVFGSREKALGWLRTPDERLQERTPLSMLATESGGRLVESMLWQIEEGIYS
jgi:putative toxin-antitoxin system antitoxin component (TIGR02293 family)